VILLTKKVDSLNRENTGLKNEVNKLTAEVKELAELRPKLEELHKTVLERELQIQQLVILNE
jgi:cell division protein FtsB